MRSGRHRGSHRSPSGRAILEGRCIESTNPIVRGDEFVLWWIGIGLMNLLPQLQGSSFHLMPVPGKVLVQVVNDHAVQGLLGLLGQCAWTPCARSVLVVRWDTGVVLSFGPTTKRARGAMRNESRCCKVVIADLVRVLNVSSLHMVWD